jgi:methylaspartate mutase sigma subunit
VFLELLLREWRMEVVNLGCCTPPQLVVEEVGGGASDLVVVSSVNGHGYSQGLELMGLIRKGCPGLKAPVVIGGRLTTAERTDLVVEPALRAAGYHSVFVGENSIGRFSQFLSGLLLPMATVA